MAKLVTKSCPDCNSTDMIEMTDHQYNRMLDRYKSGEYTSAILSDHDPDVWERFITGMCPACWDVRMEEVL